MSKADVLVMSPTRPCAMVQLAAHYTLHRYDEAQDKEAFLLEHGSICTGIVTNGHTSLTIQHLQHLPKLKIVACSSAGFESIDVDALSQRNIRFTNTSDALYDDVADLALLLSLACRRQLIAAHHYVVSGDWARQGMYPLLSNLRGKHVGIAGLGKIGQAIASRFVPLGAEIGYTARSRKSVNFDYFDSLLDLAQWSDLLVIAVPGGSATEAMVDAPILAALGSEGTLINIARGSVVDEAALIEALTTGKLGSAGLDVYADEPNPNTALTNLSNVTLYPHHASGTVETRDAMAQLVVDNLAAWYSDSPLITPVN